MGKPPESQKRVFQSILLSMPLPGNACQEKNHLWTYGFVVLSTSGFVHKWFCPQVVLSTSGFVHKWFCPQVVLSTSGFVHKWFCPQVVLSTSGFVHKWASGCFSIWPASSGAHESRDLRCVGQSCSATGSRF